MANAEHVEILKSGVEAWNKWREENEDIKPDLSGGDLTKAILSGANLTKANLFRANLTNAILSGANLTKADLSKAILSGGNLTKADLSEADLSKAILPGANMSKVDLSGATLFRANLSKADLSGATLFRADLSKTDLSWGNLSEAILSEAKLFKAILSEADLSGGTLFRADLSKANLSGVKLSGAKLGGTILGLTDLSTCIGYNSVEVSAPCTIDFQTLRASKNLPKSFLLKIGLPELYIDYLPDFYHDEGVRFFPVFLSHSWENKAFARKLYEALIAKGVIVFFDEKKMKPGDDIYKSISKGIDHYDKMILVCSKDSLNSWWVDRELDRVLKKERSLQKEEGRHIDLLIPITIDDTVFQWDGPKAEEVQRYVIGDFKNWQDDAAFEKALNELIHALNVDRPEIKPPTFLRKGKGNA